MYNILVVSKDENFLESLAADFRGYSDQYRLFIERDMERALKTAHEESIDFASVALTLPHLDSLPFLSMLHRMNPSIPIVVSTPEESTQMGDDFLKFGVRQVLLEPVSPSRLMESIQEVLFLKNQQGHLRGISIVNFLQLIEMEKKTYLLEVRRPKGSKGLFYFRKGEMYDALCGDLNGESAALEMITWDNVEIRFRTPPTKKVHRRIDKPLMSLLMDGTLLKDERSKGNGGAAVEPSGTPEPEGVLAEKLSQPSQLSTVTESVPEGIREEKISEDYILQELYPLRGVRAVTLLDESGNVLGAMGAWLGADTKKLAESVFMVQSGVERMAGDLDLKFVKSLTLESEDATIMNMPLGNMHVVILASDSKTLGIIRQKAMKIARDHGRSLQ